MTDPITFQRTREGDPTRVDDPNRAYRRIEFSPFGGPDVSSHVVHPVCALALPAKNWYFERKTLSLATEYAFTATKKAVCPFGRYHRYGPSLRDAHTCCSSEHSDLTGSACRDACSNGHSRRCVSTPSESVRRRADPEAPCRFSFPHHPRVLAITDMDLCAPIFTYVFGEAELGLKLAIVSDFRLKDGEDGTPAPISVHYERLAKVALHEIAHTLSLYHCENPKCLMQVSPLVRNLDEVDIWFCERCSFVLRLNMKDFRI